MPPKKDTSKKAAPKKATAKKASTAKPKSPEKSKKSLSLYAGGESIMGYNVKEKALKPMTVTQVCIHKVRGREKKDGTRGPSREVYRLAGEDTKTGQAMSVMSNEWSALHLVEYNKQHGIKIPIVKCESKQKPPKKEKADKPKKKPAKKADGEKKPRKPRAKTAEVTVEGEDVKVETEGHVDVVIKATKKKATPKKKVATKTTEEKPKKKAAPKKKPAAKDTEEKPKRKAAPKKKSVAKKEGEAKPKKKAPAKRAAKK
jgi:hypothetical protein